MTNDENQKSNGENKMKNPKEEILEQTGKEYFRAGDDELAKKRYNSAVVLYFKALTSFTDLFLFRKIGEIPSSHNSRFNITRSKFSDIYDLLDKDFPFYQDSYTKLMSRELAEVIKDDAEIVAKKAQIKL